MVGRFSVTKVNFVMKLVQKTANTVTYIAGNVLEPATQAFMETNANSTIEKTWHLINQHTNRRLTYIQLKVKTLLTVSKVTPALIQATVRTPRCYNPTLYGE